MANGQDLAGSGQDVLVTITDDKYVQTVNGAGRREGLVQDRRNQETVRAGHPDRRRRRGRPEAARHLRGGRGRQNHEGGNQPARRAGAAVRVRGGRRGREPRVCQEVGPDVSHGGLSSPWLPSLPRFRPPRHGLRQHSPHRTNHAQRAPELARTAIAPRIAVLVPDGIGQQSQRHKTVDPRKRTRTPQTRAETAPLRRCGARRRRRRCGRSCTRRCR